MRRIFVLLGLFSSLLFSIDYFGDEEAQSFSASIESFSNAVGLKDENTLTIHVEYPKNFKIKSLAYEYDHSEFLWKREERVNPSEVDGKNKVEIQLSYEAMQPGEKYINLPTLHFVSEKEPLQYVTLHPPLVECFVANNLEDSKALFSKGVLDLDLKKSIELDSKNRKTLVQRAEKEIKQAKLSLSPKGRSKFWPALASCFGVALLTYYLLKKSRNKKSLLKAFSSQQDPKEMAMKELKRLQDKMLPQNGFFEEFYVEITQIIRKYIERQYQIKAPEQTTQEFLMKVIDAPFFERKIKGYLEEFLKFADLVKFARLHPELSDCHQAEENAESFILSSGGET